MVAQDKSFFETSTSSQVAMDKKGWRGVGLTSYNTLDIIAVGQVNDLPEIVGEIVVHERGFLV